MASISKDLGFPGIMWVQVRLLGLLPALPLFFARNFSCPPPPPPPPPHWTLRNSLSNNSLIYIHCSTLWNVASSWSPSSPFHTTRLFIGLRCRVKTMSLEWTLLRVCFLKPTSLSWTRKRASPPPAPSSVPTRPSALPILADLSTF